MRQCQKPRVASRKSDERDVAGRHAVRAESGRHRHFRQSQPVSVAKGCPNVGPWIDGARSGEGHCGIDHRVEALGAERLSELSEHFRARSRERQTGWITLVRLLDELRHLWPVFRQNGIEGAKGCQSALDVRARIAAMR